MKCPFCGTENQEGSRFCNYCGKPLKDQEEPKKKEGSLVDTLSMEPIKDYVEYEEDQDFPEKQKKPRKWLKVLAVLILCAAIAVGGFYAYQYYQREQKEKQAKTYIEQEKFQEAIGVYQGLYKETQDKTYQKDVEKVKALEASAKAFKEAEGILKNQAEDQYPQALETFVKIKNEGNTYSEKADKDIQSLVDVAGVKVQGLLDEGQYDSAINFVNGLLEKDPNNEGLKALMTQSQEAKAAYEEQVRKEEEERQQRKRELEKKKRQAEAAAKRAIEEAFKNFNY